MTDRSSNSLLHAGPSMLVAAGLVLVLAVSAVITPADADLWGHLTFGRDIVDGRTAIQIDSYSFTSDRPWINHEWMSEVVMWFAYAVGGASGLILLKLGIISLLLLTVALELRRAGLAAQPICFLLVLTFVGTYWRTHTVRPQLFSVLFFAVLLVTMRRVDRGGLRWLIAVPAIMATWVNFHGGWIVGCGALGLWALGAVAYRQISIRTRALIAVTTAIAVVSTLINPFGIDLWRFIFETVRFERSDIQEWGSVLTEPVALGIPWLLVAATAVFGLWRGRRPTLAYTVIVTGLAIASLRVSRLDAFFALSVVLLLGPQVAARWREARATTQPVVTSKGALAITVTGILAMLVAAVVIAIPYTTCLRLSGDWQPDEHGARFIAANQLQGRMLTWFDWGEYAIWHFAPGIQVSMDGRRETVYTDRNIQAHRRFYWTPDSELQLVRGLNPDYIWLPATLPAVDALDKAGWRAIFRGERSVVFATSAERSFPIPQLPVTTGFRCFPGP